MFVLFNQIAASLKQFIKTENIALATKNDNALILTFRSGMIEFVGVSPNTKLHQYIIITRKAKLSLLALALSLYSRTKTIAEAQIFFEKFEFQIRETRIHSKENRTHDHLKWVEAIPQTLGC